MVRMLLFLLDLGAKRRHGEFSVTDAYPRNPMGVLLEIEGQTSEWFSHVLCPILTSGLGVISQGMGWKGDPMAQKAVG